MKKYVVTAGLLVLCACTKPCPVYETEIQYIKPPLPLLEPLPISPFTGSTNEDLLLYTLTLEENLSLCNARLSAIKNSVE